jgi:hypothetical protein
MLNEVRIIFNNNIPFTLFALAQRGSPSEASAGELSPA